MKPIVLTSENFQSETTNGLAIVDFWATWCGPCRILAPVIEELANEMDGVTFGKLDVDDETGIASLFSIQVIPTLIIFKNGVEVDRVTGVRNKLELRKKLEAYK